MGLDVRVSTGRMDGAMANTDSKTEYWIAFEGVYGRNRSVRLAFQTLYYAFSGIRVSQTMLRIAANRACEKMRVKRGRALVFERQIPEDDMGHGLTVTGVGVRASNPLLVLDF